MNKLPILTNEPINNVLELLPIKGALRGQATSGENRVTNHGPRATNKKMRNEPNLKNPQINIGAFEIRAYIVSCRFQRRKNEPNSNPFTHLLIYEIFIIIFTNFYTNSPPIWALSTLLSDENTIFHPLQHRKFMPNLAPQVNFRLSFLVVKNAVVGKILKNICSQCGDIQIMTEKSNTDFAEPQQQARQIRRMVIDMIYNAGSGHCGGSLSCVEILTTLYNSVLRFRPHQPHWPDRDRFILSKGHAAPTLYAVLAKAGFFPLDELSTLRKIHSNLQGHPDMKKTPGVEMSSGSLGMGISAGIGMAWTARLKKQDWRTFVLIGDGELDEGQNWEAAMLAHKLNLDNLIVIVDRNHVQLDGKTDDIMPLGNVEEKFKAFGWNTGNCDGHNCKSISDAINNATEQPGPSVIIAKTIKGKGVDFMEGDHNWHGAVMSEQQYKEAISMLEKQK